MMASIHATVNDANRKKLRRLGRYNYTTPKSFLELIDSYKHLLKTKREEVFGCSVRLLCVPLCIS